MMWSFTCMTERKASKILNQNSVNLFIKCFHTWTPAQKWSACLCNLMNCSGIWSTTHSMTTVALTREPCILVSSASHQLIWLKSSVRLKIKWDFQSRALLKLIRPGVPCKDSSNRTFLWHVCYVMLSPLWRTGKMLGSTCIFTHWKDTMSWKI